MKKIVIWGATGQLLVLNEFIKSEYQIIALFENNKNIKSPFENVPIYYGQDGLENWLQHNTILKDVYFAIAIGGDNGIYKNELSKILIEKGLLPVNLIHPKANIALTITIGTLCQILINATICADVILGNNIIVNSSASIDHECIIENGVHLAPGVILAGCVTVKENSFIGTGAIILPRITIGKNVTIGAGTVVTKNIPDNCIAYGNPAKIIKYKNLI